MEPAMFFPTEGFVCPFCNAKAWEGDDDMFMGELCRRAGLPALLISHGSHVFPKSDLERIEWGEQGHRLLRAPYPFVALQSRLAEGFLKAFPSTSKGVRTGPVIS